MTGAAAPLGPARPWPGAAADVGLVPPTPSMRRSDLALLRALPCPRTRLAPAFAGAGLLVAGASLAMADTGAAPNRAEDLYYLVILWSAGFFGIPGGLCAALGAALLTGLLGPSGGWVLHDALYLLVGALGGSAMVLYRDRARGLGDLVGRLDTTYARTLRLIAETIEMRDPITAGHSQRVAANARTLGEALGEDDLDTLYWAGLLHDVGKIALPDAVLTKPGALAPQEWDLVRGHVSVGADLISGVSPDLARVAVGVRSHHERWDGSGYAQGLSGRQIPFHGRILAVVDVFEALSCDRPYRRALPVEEARRYILDHSGEWFDPAVVAAFDAALGAGRLLVGDRRAGRIGPRAEVSAGEAPSG